MALLRGTDKIVIRDVQLAPQLLDSHHDVVDERLRRLAGLCCLLLNLLPMLIGTGQITDFIAAQPLVAGHRIPGHRRVGMADVQLIARIIDRGCQIKCFLVAHFLVILSSWQTQKTPAPIWGERLLTRYHPKFPGSSQSTGFASSLLGTVH
ncbi:hypothetical protein D3C73_664130 [compost metagenome]